MPTLPTSKIWHNTKKLYWRNGKILMCDACDCSESTSGSAPCACCLPLVGNIDNPTMRLASYPTSVCDETPFSVIWNWPSSAASTECVVHILPAASGFWYGTGVTTNPVNAVIVTQLTDWTWRVRRVNPNTAVQITFTGAVHLTEGENGFVEVGCGEADYLKARVIYEGICECDLPPGSESDSGSDGDGLCLCCPNDLTVNVMIGGINYPLTALNMSHTAGASHWIAPSQEFQNVPPCFLDDPGRRCNPDVIFVGIVIYCLNGRLQAIVNAIAKDSATGFHCVEIQLRDDDYVGESPCGPTHTFSGVGNSGGPGTGINMDCPWEVTILPCPGGPPPPPPPPPVP